MDLWLQDVRFAWRRLVRSPAFAAAAILTLALGIGANAIVFGFLNAMILRPLPVAHPEELVFLNSGANGTGPNFSHPKRRSKSATRGSNHGRRATCGCWAGFDRV